MLKTEIYVGKNSTLLYCLTYADRVELGKVHAPISHKSVLILGLSLLTRFYGIVID